ncbi:MAG TPA: hypothetical protein PK385_11115 [Spirochaetota bacterium]|nr:hypothetical protein [Spirochaetota bacterium]HOS34032.1 hypothetical protein [Spirochaetota bacterium]HOS56597.1 hypothetical protein [Spirochaetota bacterium]HPK61921.1 hypothetical protein [Spirochaetota bacterium]HQF78869.1 hypothetical protein [Spirochaetota bacterium]
MKKIFILIIIFAVSASLFADQTEDSTKFVPNKELDRLTVAKIAYWSSYSTTGLYGFIVSLAYLANIYDVSQVMLGVAEDFKNAGISDMAFFMKIAKSLPLIYFTGHFIIAGLAQIPIYGGLIYGSFLFTGALIGSICMIFDPIDMFWRYDISSAIEDEYKNRLNNIHKRMFDPAPYIVLGSISILFGIASIVTDYFYKREMKRERYPSIYKILSFTPDGIAIKLDA